MPWSSSRYYNFFHLTLKSPKNINCLFSNNLEAFLNLWNRIYKDKYNTGNNYSEYKERFEEFGLKDYV
jgi:hypothetical protein